MPAKMPLRPEDLLQQQVSSHAPSVAVPVFYGGGTCSYLPSKIPWSENSGESSYASPAIPVLPRNLFRDERQLVNLHKSFIGQLEGKRDVLGGQSDYLLVEKMKLSAEPILACLPDKISLEVTWDGSIFYKVVKNDLTVHFEHFLVEEFDGSDEVMMTIYKSDIQVLLYGDTLINAVNALSKFLASHKIVMPQFA